MVTVVRTLCNCNTDHVRTVTARKVTRDNVAGWFGDNLAPLTLADRSALVRLISLVARGDARPNPAAPVFPPFHGGGLSSPTTPVTCNGVASAPVAAGWPASSPDDPAVTRTRG